MSVGSLRSGAASVAAPLRKLPALVELILVSSEIGDEGVASLVANLGKDEFKKLEHLNLYGNKITEAGTARLVDAIEAGGLPNLRNCHGAEHVQQALQRRRA